MKTKTKTKIKKTTKPTDAERIVSELLASLRPGLTAAIEQLVNLGVERKVDEVRASILTAFKAAA